MAASLVSSIARRAIPSTATFKVAASVSSKQWRRHRSTDPSARPEVTKSSIPDFAFAFDIDGVLMRSADAIQGAHEALSYLQQQRIPFILLTNGGGKSEKARVDILSRRLKVHLDISMLIQSHTPFADFEQHKDRTVLVVGGDYDHCQKVACEEYGFAHAVTPGDILVAYPEIWPFSRVFLPYYQRFAKPLPKPIIKENPNDSLKIDAIHVYNDPRDWGLDATIMLDLLMSQGGTLGTLSPKNGDSSLPNNGYLQDSQPGLYYSNPDLWWASEYHLPRLGQGGFREAFAGLWAAATKGAELTKTVMGKPHQPTFEYAEKQLRAHRKSMFSETATTTLNDPLRRVYMVGDNPESDIRGAKNYESPHGSRWTSILVKTGVYREGTKPSCEADVIVDDVQAAVQWAMQDAKGR